MQNVVDRLSSEFQLIYRNNAIYRCATSIQVSRTTYTKLHQPYEQNNVFGLQRDYH